MSEDAKHKAQVFLHRGNLPQARFWYEQAVEDDRENGTSQALSNSLGNLGNVCALMGEYEDAARCYREVLEL